MVLPEPVGPVTMHDAVGLVDELAEDRQVVVAQPELFQVQRHVGAVQHAHDHALAEHRRQHADAQVDRAGC